MKGFRKLKKAAKRAGVTWVTAWMVVAALILTGLIGYASYTGVTMVKRVVSTKSGAGLLFSSNYLTTGTLTSIEYGNYSDYLDGQGNPLSTNPTYTMNVCNYSQGDKATWYTSGNISYTVTAELLLNERYTAEEAAALGNNALAGQYKPPTAADLAGKTFGIKYSSDSSFHNFSVSQLSITLPASGTYTLNKSAASADAFTILMDKSELLSNAPNFWIRLTATPTSVAGGEVEVINGYLGLCKNASGDVNWTGVIGDEDYTTQDYDAYNYIISGNGTGTFYFAWDDTRVNLTENDLVFTGVTIDDTKRNVAFTGGAFKGIFSPTTLPAGDASNLYLGAGNTLYWPAETGTGRTINAFRAYFHLGNGAGARQFVLNFGDGDETTGIISIENGKLNNESGWYTVDGKKLDQQPTRKGLYIHNGVKVAIK